jgi:anti-sigma B factor antagonist
LTVIRRHHERHGAFFDCVVDQEGTIFTFVLKGEIDLLAVQQLEGQIQVTFAGEERLVVLDLAGVGFIDSTGLRLLLRLRDQVASHGGNLLIGRLSRPVKRLLDLTKLSDHFEYLDGSAVTPLCPTCERVLVAEDERCGHCGSTL